MFRKNQWFSLSIFFLASFFFLFSLPQTTALTMQITTPLAEQYSYGDTVHIDGYIFTERFIQGTLRLVLQCNASENYVISQRSISLGRNTKTRLSELLTTNLLLQKPLGKRCYFHLVLEDDEQKYEESSSSFIITTTLYGDVNVHNDHIALGEVLWLEGRFFTPQGKDINGNAVFSLKEEENTFYLGEAPITEGKLETKLPIKNIPEGNYRIFYEVNDIYGNHMQFSGPIVTILPSASFSVIITNPQLKPYQDLIFSFAANSYDYDVAVDVFTHHYLFHENTTNSTHRLQVPLLPKGMYIFKATYHDSLGNQVEESIPLEISAHLTSFQLETKKTIWYQNETFQASILGYDQDNDSYPLSEERHHYLYSLLSIGNAVILHGTTTVPMFSFSLQNISPGNYTLIVFDQEAGIDTAFDLTVRGVPRLTIIEKDGTYYVINEGTAFYNGTINVTLKTGKGEQAIAKDLLLAPQEMKPLTKAIPVEELLLSTSQHKYHIPGTNIKEISGSLVFPSLGKISVLSLLFTLAILSGVLGWKYWKKRKNTKNNDYYSFR